jgi:uncharacterized membrane protein YfcA
VQPRDLDPRLLGYDGLVGDLNDRREDAVDVEEDPRALRRLCKPGEQGGVAVHAPRIRAVPVKLVAIGLVAGLFSALFGVGGGIVIVPLLIMFLAFAGKVATGTSLAAIGITAVAGTILYAFEGHVDPAYAALVGVPAAAGAITGTAIQQRISGRALTLAFAGLLTVLAIWLLVS